MSPSKQLRYVVAGVAAVALGFGAYAIGNSNSGTSSNGVANASRSLGAGGGQSPGSGRVPPGSSSSGGQLPPGGAGAQGPGGFGTPVTGSTADKVASAATAKYKGTVERVVK